MVSSSFLSRAISCVSSVFSACCYRNKRSYKLAFSLSCSISYLVSIENGCWVPSITEGLGSCVVSKDLSKELEFASNLLMNTKFEVVQGEAESGSPGRCGCGVELNYFY
jgi:hypothetical protein